MQNHSQIPLKLISTLCIVFRVGCKVRNDLCSTFHRKLRSLCAYRSCILIHIRLQAASELLSSSSSL